jgi:hypothetical protein
MKLIVSPALERDLLRWLDQTMRHYRAPNERNPLLGLTARELFGIPLQVSYAFPFPHNCDACQGSGYPGQGSYCRECQGRGSFQIIGMLMGAVPPMILLKSAGPQLYPPRFPLGLVTPPPPVRIATPTAPPSTKGCKICSGTGAADFSFWAIDPCPCTEGTKA